MRDRQPDWETALEALGGGFVLVFLGLLIAKAMGFE